MLLALVSGHASSNAHQRPYNRMVPFRKSPRPYTGLWLGRNEETDPYSSPYITHYEKFPFSLPFFIPS